MSARARALGMKVLVHDPFVSAERCRELQVTQVTLDELWAQAEFITLHAPLTPETRHVVNDESIAAMRPGVRIVNDARGDLVDIDALVRGLESGKIAGAGLDVFPSEPYTEGEVLKLPNVVVTPHLGASTREAQDRAGVIVAEQVVAALTGEFVVQRREHPADRRRGHGGGRARTCRSPASSAGWPSGCATWGPTGSRSCTRAAWPTTTLACSPRR